MGIDEEHPGMSKSVRKFIFGFSPKKDADGQPIGSAAIKLKPRNAYEYLGLRRPLSHGFGKA